MTISFIQGTAAGGATSYLRHRMTQEASEKKVDTWATAALQANHVLLLSAETIGSAGVSLGSFGLATQAAYVFTPVVFAAVGLAAKRIAPLSPERADQLNQVYRAAVIVNSLASLALGNPVFAGASLAMLAIDVVLEGNAKEVFHYLNKVAAALAFVGYGTQTFLANGAMATLGKVSTLVAGAKFFLIDNCDSEGSSVIHSSSDLGYDPMLRDHRFYSERDYYPYGTDLRRLSSSSTYPLERMPSTPRLNVDLSGKGNWTWFTRGNGAWG